MKSLQNSVQAVNDDSIQYSKHPAQKGMDLLLRGAYDQDRGAQWRSVSLDLGQSIMLRALYAR